MASTTSLLKSAVAARKKIQAQEDAQREFEWSISAKTLDDLLDYQGYIEGRIDSSTDASSLLSYQRKLYTTQRSFTTQEIERQSIAILEGTSTSTDKYNSIIGLYQMAENMGDYDSMQSLRLRADNLQQTIFNEQERAQGVAREMANRQVTTMKQLQNSYVYGSPEGKNGDMDPNIISMRWLSEQIENQGVDYFNSIGAAVSQALGLPQQASFWDAQLALADQMLGAYNDAIATMGDPEARQNLIEARNNFTDGSIITIGGKSFGYNDLVFAQQTQAAGNPAFVFAEGTNKVIETKTTGYRWAVDQNGNYYIAERRNVSAAPTRKYTYKDPVTGKMVENADLKQALDAQGIEVISGGDSGEFTLRQKSGTNLGIPGLDPTSVIQAYVTDSGALQFIVQNEQGQKQIYSLDFDKEGRIAASEYTAIQSKFYEDLTMPKAPSVDEFTRNLVKPAQDIAQLLQPMSPDVPGMSAPATSSGVLQQAQNQKLIQQTAQMNLQATPTPQLNQMIAPNVNLQVAKPPTAPRISVAPTPTPPRLSVQPTTPGKISVPNANPQQAGNLGTTAKPSAGYNYTNLLQGGNSQLPTGGLKVR